jgi:hypothetical protein
MSIKLRHRIAAGLRLRMNLKSLVWVAHGSGSVRLFPEGHILYEQRSSVWSKRCR